MNKYMVLFLCLILLLCSACSDMVTGFFMVPAGLGEPIQITASTREARSPSLDWTGTGTELCVKIIVTRMVKSIFPGLVQLETGNCVYH